MTQAMAVALHDVEPATFARCREIRRWLDDHGIDRVTLLVIPAVDLHPFFQRSPALAEWLRERRAAGDAIAQHGLVHRRVRTAPPLRAGFACWQAGLAAEFPGLSAQEVHDHVSYGRSLLAMAGLEPRGFVAPGYAHTFALRRELRQSFDWWATLFALHGARSRRWPAFGLGTSTALKRAASPPLLHAASRLDVRTLRLDLHPADFEHPRHVRALEQVLRRADGRRPVTYDDLAE